MHHKATVDWRDGWLCVKYSDTRYSEPVRDTLWWPVRQVPREDAAHLVGREAHEAGTGAYTVRTANHPAGFWMSLPLVNGGQTHPIATAAEEIPPPKTRKGIETRYRQGQWMKYLKTQGWVAA